MQSSLSNESDIVHVKLDFIDAIMSVCDDVWDCHPQAKYWLPLANFDRLDVYLRLANITKINCVPHFTKLLASRIVVQLNKSTKHD